MNGTREQTETQVSRDLSETNLDQILGYDVLDKNNEDVGNISALWADHTHQAAFIGVKTSWLLGKTHVVPAYGATINHPRRHLRIAYSKDDVKNAPSYDPDAQLDYAHEQEILSYYRNKGPTLPEQEGAPQEHWQQREGLTEQERLERERLARERRPAGESQEARIPLHEEELTVGKREVEAGGIRLRKIVRTETVQQPVEVRREDIVVERVPATERQPAGKAFEGEDIYIPLRREEPVVSKETHVREEVRARKTAETQRQTVSGQVRKEEVQVEDERQRRERGK